MFTSAWLGESKKILNNSAFMQSERSISLLNLFHQKSPKWIYQSPPNPPQFPQNSGYHSPKDSSYLFMVCRGWHLKMGGFYIKLYQDSVSNAKVFCYLITKPLISYFLMMTLKNIQVRHQKSKVNCKNVGCENFLWQFWWFPPRLTVTAPLIHWDGRFKVILPSKVDATVRRE